MKGSGCVRLRLSPEFFQKQNEKDFGANVRKSDLFDLIADVNTVAPDEPLIIAGSQATHAVTEYPPELARKSVECDFLFAVGKAEVREKINKELGVLTDYQDEHGYYADAVGLATIVLPSGWENRVRPLHGPNGNVLAKCIDIYDVAVSKLVAGRAKDLEFLESAFISELILAPEFLERTIMVSSKVENDVLENRLNRLVKELGARRIHSELIAQIRIFLTKYQTRT